MKVNLDPKLSVAKWNSEKSIIAKLKTKTNETGISTALQALATAHHAVVWDDLEAKTQVSDYANEAAVKTQMQKTAGEIHKLNLVIGAAREVKKQAEVALPLFKASKIIPAKSTQFVRTLVGESDLLIGELNEALKSASETLKDLNETAKAKAQGF